MRGGKNEGARDKVHTFNVVGEGTSGNYKVISIVCRIEIDKKRRKDNEQK